MTSKITDAAGICIVGTDAYAPHQEDLNELSRLLEKYAPHDDTFDLTKDGIHVVKASKPAKEQTYMLSLPGICIVPQGTKSVSLAQGSFEYGESRMVVYAAEVPMNVKVTKASKEKPFLCLVIPINPHRLGELILKVFPNGVSKADHARAALVCDSNPKIIRSALRIMSLIENQEDTDLLVPLVVDEILIRLLQGPAGASIAQIGITDSHTEKITKAITWLKGHFTEPVKMENLARIAGMSISSFYTHFKAFTSMSPLQFQKTLRLQEARNLMMTKMMDVSSTSFEVGYASASQFSREYSRFFGIAPIRDIQKARDQ